MCFALTKSLRTFAKPDSRAKRPRDLGPELDEALRLRAPGLRRLDRGV
jgi:hypothetical protein